jgi:class 3 adenylate cyclase/tetratricopeptide (TPR) repeat protein
LQPSATFFSVCWAVATCGACGHANREGARFCDECGARLDVVAPPAEERKVVTVLFCDVTGSTALGERLDAEVLRALLARYFDRMRDRVQRHGGTVEKFIGDAVMAVFGVPTVHEDDALRAIRAALDMRAAFPDLGIQGRIGIATGEVVVGTDERLATGDAVNVAARLQQAAAPGEIVIAAATYDLAAGAVDAVRLDQLELRGKSEPVMAYRVADLDERRDRDHHGQMVGRERQLRQLATAFEQACEDRACHLFTVLGDAGVGKSRLIEEFLAVGDARVVRGRCLAYGEGITFWPVVEVLKQLAVRPDDSRADAALAALLGESDRPATASDISWGVRLALERAAGDGPLVVVWDDIHWAEQVFLDLINHLAELSRGVPLLVICMARPELLDRRPEWAGGKLNATTILLEPLTPDDTDALLDQLDAPGGQLRARIREMSSGNPLFVEQMLALAAGADNGEAEVPATIQALLAARLDQLDPAERAVLQRGSVEGQLFHVGAVEALTVAENGTQDHLRELVRKDLLRPERAQLPGEEAFRFRHILLRDAAYGGLSKSARAELHLRFAAWLERVGEGLVELDEVLGYHLEQCVHYLEEVGRPVDPDVAAAARRRLTAATQRAMVREDYAAVTSLAARAIDLVPEDEIDGGLESDRLDAAGFTGQLDDISRYADDAVERARRVGDRAAELMIRLTAGTWETLVHTDRGVAALDHLIDEALPELEAVGDDLALTGAYFAKGWSASWRGHGAEQLEACQQSLEHARRVPGRHEASTMLRFLPDAHLFGPTTAHAMSVWLDEHSDDGRHDFRLCRAVVLAMLDRSDEAINMIEAERTLLAEQGNLTVRAFSGQRMCFVATLAERPDLAERWLADACEFFETHGEGGTLSTLWARRAVVLADLGEVDAADAATARAVELTAADDIINGILIERAKAKIQSERQDHREAVTHAQRAVAVALETDFHLEQADAYLDLAQVLAHAGGDAEARSALEAALAQFRVKGCIAGERIVRERLDALGRGSPHT